VTLEHVRRFNEVIVDRDQNEVVHLHYVLPVLGVNFTRVPAWHSHRRGEQSEILSNS
jgi:hypothetical protein